MECGFVSIIKPHLYSEEEVYTGAWHDYLKIMFISLTFCTGNGVIDFPEFVKLMEDQKKPDEREADMMLAFRVFDADNKGYIESAELRYIILNMDKRIPRDELDELIAIADLERDRKISYQGREA